jgi:hypothetical protein
VISPVSRNHYFVLLLPAVLFVPLWLNQRGRRRAAIFLTMVPIALILLQYLLMPYVGRVGLLGLGLTGWLMAAMILIDRTSRSQLATTVDASNQFPTIQLHQAA